MVGEVPWKPSNENGSQQLIRQSALSPRFHPLSTIRPIQNTSPGGHWRRNFTLLSIHFLEGVPRMRAKPTKRKKSKQKQTPADTRQGWQQKLVAEDAALQKPKGEAREGSKATYHSRYPACLKKRQKKANDPSPHWRTSSSRSTSSLLIRDLVTSFQKALDLARSKKEDLAKLQANFVAFLPRPSIGCNTHISHTPTQKVRLTQQTRSKGLLPPVLL